MDDRSKTLETAENSEELDEKASFEVILLDSHVLAWFYQGGAKLGLKCRAMTQRHAAVKQISVSALSYFELDYAVRHGSLKLQGDAGELRDELQATGIHEIVIDGEICLRAAQIRHAFIDPFDALIVATADVNGLSLVTADERILAWRGRVKRIDARK